MDNCKIVQDNAWHIQNLIDQDDDCLVVPVAFVNVELAKLEDRIKELEIDLQESTEEKGILKGIVKNISDTVKELESDGWISVKDSYPDVRALAFTPDQSEEFEFRIIPAGLFKQVAKDATYWKPMTFPIT